MRRASLVRAGRFSGQSSSVHRLRARRLAPFISLPSQIAADRCRPRCPPAQVCYARRSISLLGEARCLRLLIALSYQDERILTFRPSQRHRPLAPHIGQSFACPMGGDDAAPAPMRAPISCLISPEVIADIASPRYARAARKHAMITTARPDRR